MAGSASDVALCKAMDIQRRPSSEWPALVEAIADASVRSEVEEYLRGIAQRIRVAVEAKKRLES